MRPVARARCKAGGNVAALIAVCATAPMRKQPTTLTINVP
jgi:hypothetical protein